MIRVVSLFCGIGAADAGLYAAARDLGIEVEVVAAIDSWGKAVEVYNANLPHPVARVADVKQLAKADLPPHDLVIGGPPCQDHSLAGARRCQCNTGGFVSPRCCLADFQRLALDTPWLMENVRARLIEAPFSLRISAKNFGDVTKRKRWFYSDHLLDVIPNPGPRRIRDIRDPAGDERWFRRLADQPVDRKKGDTRGVVTVSASTALLTDDDMLPSLISHAWHGRDLRSNTAQLLEIPLLGMRGHSASASASAFNDNEFLGSFVSNSWHGNEHSKLTAARNPTLLEMQRAHSLPDNFDWCGAGSTARGLLIANSWPIGMATAVCRAMLVAMGAR